MLSLSRALFRSGAVLLGVAALSVWSMLRADSEPAGAGRALLSALFGVPALLALAASVGAAALAWTRGSTLERRAALRPLSLAALLLGGSLAWLAGRMLGWS